MEKSEETVLNKESEFGRRMIYEKDSMDRLADDLTEEVLQYLTFSDKVRLECVSKQWMRCVYKNNL